MKLRARKKSFPSKIKQEDRNPSLINDQLSTTEVASTSTFGLTVKQEDSKDHKVLLKQQSMAIDMLIDMHSNGFLNLNSVLEHRSSNHISKRYKNITMPKNLVKEPDLNNPGFYCESCEKGYSNKHRYREHLRAAHFMVLKQFPKRAAQKTDVAPDPNDPNFYCRACDFTYTQKDTYKSHCRYAHGLKPAESANQTSSSSKLTDSYCQTCDKRLSSIGSYRRHLFVVHEIENKQIQQERIEILPNVDDPNFYCHSCEKKLGSKVSFITHLQLVHSIFKSAPPQSELKPDIDDPNNHCRACRKGYPSKGIYRTHLRIVHQMVLSPLRYKFSPKQLPDPYNRDTYCIESRIQKAPGTSS
ncbi:C2H2-type zinc finger transcription factor [Mucor lusitanicus]